MQIEVEAVLHRGAVDLGDQPAGPRQRGAVEAHAFADAAEFVRRLPRMPAAAAADMDAEFARERREAALQRADHAGRDAGGMPVHPHHGAERLEPERMRQTAQEFVAAIMMHDRLGDHRAKPRHALASHGGTRPLWSGRSALPVRRATNPPESELKTKMRPRRRERKTTSDENGWINEIAGPNQELERLTKVTLAVPDAALASRLPTLVQTVHRSDPNDRKDGQ